MRRKVQGILRNQLTVEVELKVVVAVNIASDVLGPGFCVEPVPSKLQEAEEPTMNKCGRVRGSY